MQCSFPIHDQLIKLQNGCLDLVRLQSKHTVCVVDRNLQVQRKIKNICERGFHYFVIDYVTILLCTTNIQCSMVHTHLLMLFK